MEIECFKLSHSFVSPDEGLKTETLNECKYIKLEIKSFEHLVFISHIYTFLSCQIYFQFCR